MFCSNCGNKLIDGARFCNSCGASIVNNTNAKLEQAYQKAQLTLGHTKEFEYFQSLYLKAEKANNTNFIFRLAKSGYSWALLFCVAGLLLLLISIAFGSDELGMIGGGAEVVAMWVALMTMVNNDSKKKKDND